MAISGISSGANGSAWAVQRPDAARVASNLLSQVDAKGSIDKTELQSAFDPLSADDKSGSASDVEKLLKQVEANNGDKLSTQELTDGIKQLAAQLAAQFDNARVARAEVGPKPSTDDILASLDTGNQGYIDKQALQTAFDKKSTDTAANTAKVDQVFKTLDTNGDDKITKVELTAGVDKLAEQDGTADAVAADGATTRAGGARPPHAGGGSKEVAANEVIDAADANEDGTVSLQEQVTYQTAQAAKQKEAETKSQASLEAVEKVVTQLTQTYGKFDQDIANAAMSVNPISATA